MEAEHRWKLWPLEAYVLDELTLTIRKIVGHMSGQWWGTDMPWWTVVLEPVIPKAMMSRSETLRKNDRESLVAGVVPDGLYTIRCISVSHSWLRRVEEVKTFRHGHLTVYYWGTRNHIIRLEDPGDHVGMPGGIVFLSQFGLEIEGYPELPLRYSETDRREHLAGVCAWLDMFMEGENG